MNSVFAVLKTFLITVIAGAVGAGVIVVATSDGDILGAASGKKVINKQNKKKKDSPLWNEIGQELEPTPMPTSPVPESTPVVGQPNANPGVEIPEEPLLDPHDPAQCARNMTTEANVLGNVQSGIARLVVRGEVRGYMQSSNPRAADCEVELYPRGCDFSFKFAVRPELFAAGEDSERAQLMCSAFAQAFFHRRQIFVHAYAPNNDLGHQTTKNAVSTYFSARSMQEIVQMIAAEEAQVAESADGLSNLIGRTVGR